MFECNADELECECGRINIAERNFERRVIIHGSDAKPLKSVITKVLEDAKKPPNDREPNYQDVTHISFKTTIRSISLSPPTSFQPYQVSPVPWHPVLEDITQAYGNTAFTIAWPGPRSGDQRTTWSPTPTVTQPAHISPHPFRGYHNVDLSTLTATVMVGTAPKSSE